MKSFVVVVLQCCQAHQSDFFPVFSPSVCVCVCVCVCVLCVCVCVKKSVLGQTHSVTSRGNFHRLLLRERERESACGCVYVWVGGGVCVWLLLFSVVIGLLLFIDLVFCLFVVCFAVIILFLLLLLFSLLVVGFYCCCWFWGGGAQWEFTCNSATLCPF